MKLLIVVDMQNDFIDGSLGTPEAQTIVPNVITKIKQYNNHDSFVIYTQDIHSDNYLGTMEGKKLPVPHCIAGTDGAKIPDDIRNACDRDFTSYVIPKNTFGSTFLPSFISSNFRRRIESIELIGLCTDVCVISNAMILKAYFPEIPITIDSSCCAGVTPESHKNALEAMKMCQIEVV